MGLPLTARSTSRDKEVCQELPVENTLLKLRQTQGRQKGSREKEKDTMQR